MTGGESESIGMIIGCDDVEDDDDDDEEEDDEDATAGLERIVVEVDDTGDADGIGDVDGEP